MFDSAPAPRQLVLAELRRRIDTVAARSDNPTSDAERSAVRSVVQPCELPARESPRIDSGQQVPAPEFLSPIVRRDVFPVPAPLAPALPLGGLPKGGIVSVVGGQGVTSLLFTLLAAPVGTWVAVVGMPGMGLLAAAELGVDLERLVIVPDPGPDIWQVLSVLADGVDFVVVAPPRGMDLRQAGRLRILSSRLRQRGAVLLVAGHWPGADLVLRAEMGTWTGMDAGHGRLRDRTLTVDVSGRGAAGRGAGRPRTVAMTLTGRRTGVEVRAAQESVVELRPAWTDAAVVGG